MYSFVALPFLLLKSVTTAWEVFVEYDNDIKSNLYDHHNHHCSVGHGEDLVYISSEVYHREYGRVGGKEQSGRQGDSTRLKGQLGVLVSVF